MIFSQYKNNNECDVNMLLGDQEKSRQLSFHVYERHVGRFLVGLYLHDNSRVSKPKICCNILHNVEGKRLSVSEVYKSAVIKKK